MTTLIDSFIEFQRDDTGRTPATEWVICSACRGNGTSTAYLGAYTQSDREEMGEEEWYEFMADVERGHYDRHCDNCEGTGKVRTIPADGPWAEAWEEWLRDEAEDRAVRRAESGYAW